MGLLSKLNELKQSPGRSPGLLQKSLKTLEPVEIEDDEETGTHERQPDSLKQLEPEATQTDSSIPDQDGFLEQLEPEEGEASAVPEEAAEQTYSETQNIVFDQSGGKIDTPAGLLLNSTTDLSTAVLFLADTTRNVWLPCAANRVSLPDSFMQWPSFTDLAFLSSDVEMKRKLSSDELIQLNNFLTFEGASIDDLYLYRFGKPESIRGILFHAPLIGDDSDLSAAPFSHAVDLSCRCIEQVEGTVNEPGEEEKGYRVDYSDLVDDMLGANPCLPKGYLIWCLGLVLTTFLQSMGRVCSTDRACITFEADEKTDFELVEHQIDMTLGMYVQSERDPHAVKVVYPESDS